MLNILIDSPGFTLTLSLMVAKMALVNVTYFKTWKAAVHLFMPDIFSPLLLVQGAPVPKD